MLEALLHLLVSRNEKLVDLDSDESGASCRLHRGLKLLEDRALEDLSLVLLHNFVTLDLDQVVE